MGLKVGSLFSGIGGIDLGLERAGMRVVWQCESDPYCRAILRKHWPTVRCYEDVREIGADAPAVDLLCGGFPCQPVSVAGRRLAQADPRWLWPEFARCIRDLRPQFVLVENVPGLLAQGMGDVLGDLAESGYDAEWDCIPAAALGAPHLRYRVFVVAYSQRERLRLERGRSGRESREGPLFFAGDGEDWQMADANKQGLERRSKTGGCSNQRLARKSGDPMGHSYRMRQLQSERSIGTLGGWAGDAGWWLTEPNVGRVAHGIPSRVDRLRALGNAVVPQVAEWIGNRILEGNEDGKRN